MLWLLVKNLFLRHINEFMYKTPLDKGGDLFSATILLAVHISLFLVSTLFFSLLTNLSSSDLHVYLFSVLLAGILLYLLLAAISDAIYYFLLSPDLILLFSMPIPPHILFIYKLIEIAWSKAFLLGLVLAIICGYGYGLGAPLYYYPVAGILFLCFSFFPIAVGILVAALPVRITKSARTRVIFQGSAEIMFFILLMGVLSHTSFYASVSESYLEQFYGLVSSPFWRWLPSGWLANALSLLAAGGIASMFKYALPLVIIPYLLLHWLSLKNNIWAVFPEPTTEDAKGKRHFTSFDLSPFFTLLRFHSLLLVRDHRYVLQKASLLFIMAIPFIFNYDFYRFKHYYFYLHLYPIFSLISDSILIYRERKSFWWLKVCPCNLHHFVLAKLLLSFLINVSVVSFGLGFLLVLHGKDVTFYTGAIAWLRLAGVCLAFSSLSILVGSIFPGFHRPKLTLSSKGSIVCFIMIIGALLYVSMYRNIFTDTFASRVFAELAISSILFLCSIWIASKALLKLEWKL
jgi:hypothetical protein